MQSLHSFFNDNKVKSLLAIFAHPDDESFVSGGLFQEAQKLGIMTSLICMTKGGRGLNAYKSGNLKEIRSKELDKAVKILDIDKTYLWDYPDADLRSTKDNWVSDLEKQIIKTNPDLILTFDPSGITGHPDHLVTCIETLNLIKKMKKKPFLIWRVPDDQEKNKYFHKNDLIKYAKEANMELNYGLKESLKKIKAIYSHKSQMKNIKYKLQILEWFLFDHRELYYRVDLSQNYKYKFVHFTIEKK